MCLQSFSVFQNSIDVYYSKLCRASGFEESFSAADLLTLKEPVKASHCLYILHILEAFRGL